MKSLKLALVFFALVIFAISCSTTDNQTANTTRQPSPAATTPSTPTPTPDELAAARSDFNDTCVRCHKANGEGGTVELDDGKPLKIPSFKSGHALERSDADFIRQITNGGDGMPAFKGRLSPERIENLVRFIRREFQSGANAPASPAQTGSGHK